MFDITVRIDKGAARLGRLPDDIRAALREEARQQAIALQAAAKANAGSYFQVRTGRYQRSIRRSVRSNAKGVVGKVFSKSPIAHILEEGAVRGAHEELPKNVQALNFVMGGSSVYAARVLNPGSRVTGRAVINNAFQDRKDQIREGLRGAVTRTTAASQATAA
jgi:hypothetical protein